jgi:hypothetical protein
MAKRGKILRDPHVGPGLLMLEGQQHQFFLEGVWKSDVPPKTGLVVEVELDSLGKVVAITAVPESQIAKEQAELALAAAKKKGCCTGIQHGCQVWPSTVDSGRTSHRVLDVFDCFLGAIAFP